MFNESFTSITPVTPPGGPSPAISPSRQITKFTPSSTNTSRSRSCRGKASGTRGNGRDQRQVSSHSSNSSRLNRSNISENYLQQLAQRNLQDLNKHLDNLNNDHAAYDIDSDIDELSFLEKNDLDGIPTSQKSQAGSQPYTHNTSHISDNKEALSDSDFLEESQITLFTQEEGTQSSRADNNRDSRGHEYHGRGGEAKTTAHVTQMVREGISHVTRTAPAHDEAYISSHHHFQSPISRPEPNILSTTNHPNHPNHPFRSPSPSRNQPLRHPHNQLEQTNNISHARKRRSRDKPSTSTASKSSKDKRHKSELSHTLTQVRASSNVSKPRPRHTYTGPQGYKRSIRTTLQVTLEFDSDENE